MFRTMNSVRIRPDVSTFTALTKCFCQMGKVDFGFSVVGNIFKSGFEADIVIFTTLLKGLFKENRVKMQSSCFTKLQRTGIRVILLLI
ncbi:hypothetical protein GIB67_003641 [Kingdonia uniflora]|uniref:Pentatricopeptide repeat-containing protein n=1 Tax=Kingdonia uniflora TaxID=39325 RepID=A0A7J7MF07_9MAGN|nr:hypothetical protein GIB67_003641 [Kingdonia uniflora]